MYFLSETNEAFMIISFLLAIVATVLAFVFIVPEKRRETLNAFGRFLHDTFNFKYLIVEKILQALYIFATAYTILGGFFMLFQTTPAYSDFYGTSYGSSWLGGYGILVMIVGPIIIRLVYELLMLIIILVKNVISINSKLKNQNGTMQKDFFSAPDISEMKADIQQRVNARREAAQQRPAAPVTPAAPVAPVQTPEAPAQTEAAPKFCSDCGNRLGDDGSCPNCNK